MQQDLYQCPIYAPYEKYVTQLLSCSTEGQPPILCRPSANSSEVAEQTFPVMNKNTGESSSSFSSYMNPCRINLDYFDSMWNEQKDLRHQTTDKHHGNWSGSMSNTAVGGSHLLNSLGADHHDGRCLGNGRPMQESLEMKYDWGTFNSKLSPSEVGYVPPLEFSSELPEVNNPTVDSPCWKGAPVAYHPSFGIMKNADTPHSVKVAGSYNSSHQIEKAPEWSLKYPELFSKQHEISASECDHLKTFNLTVTRKNSEDHKEVPPVSVGDVGNYFPEEQHARGQKCYNSGEDFKNMITVTVGRQERPLPASKAKLLGEHSANDIVNMTEKLIKKVPNPLGSAPRVSIDSPSESLSVNVSSQAAGPEESTQLHILTKGGQEQSHYYSASVGNMLKTSCESISKTRAVFLKQMYDLSVMILSTCNGGSSLQEYEEDLLQSVIQNLSASSRRSKAENMSGARNNLLMAMPEHSVVENTSKLKTFISQALAKLGEDKMLDDTDVSQLSIYKNLWIEAEASVCKLKYELQLARVKLATMKSHNNTQQVPVDSLEGNTDSISVIPNSKPENRAKESSACPVSLHYHGGDSGDMQPPAVNRSIIDGVDADVFARLEILRSCVDNVSSFGENNCKEQEQANKKQCRVEDAVMARLRVLNSRPDNTTSLKQENNHLLDVSTRADTIDDVVMSRLRILKFRPDNIPPLGEESSKHEPYASTNIPNEVDQAVMSRLRILKCRNDNLNSSVDVSKKNIETCTDRPNWDEDGSMAKMQALSCNTASIVEECQNILHSANFVNHLEGKGSVGGLDSFGDATCSDEGKGCKAASDEVNDKSAIQHGDGFATNIAWPQTAMDSHICTAGSQETAQISSPVHKYDMSPPGWEHVLKENFFHPGN
ncbi:hypothetical protein GUJ93_ZPchr0010g10872 [Zizania palustris]|uniref:Uncharacterized protein n=1 Tax=Zizania palustris TaxID=103762 RepID=A0A8J5VT86_ZIZPA|nr:hypothetical protein GUJ93_ZPchr0010g10872 [Zizania palustris]KAG8083988.1 hypothetical protein GUJ93_ZPchr0010g10872 [Zizania palustris]